MTELPTFHIKHPSSFTYLTWDELGCLSRALGFPSDLFQRYFPRGLPDVVYDAAGMSCKTLEKILQMTSFNQSLNRTFNLHTAQWNVTTIRTALNILQHKALSFDDIHNVRVAYTTYEDADMKGMSLHKHLLLRTLKFCNRIISPMKLMHRVKHMRNTLDERGRIQLYEFLRLVLWCDIYTCYDPREVENATGKVNELFKLVNFRRLLSHHDQRLTQALNDQYIKEERDYGHVSLGKSHKFTEPTINTEPRIVQVQLHNEKYQHLKQEIVNSQRRVHQAHAGTFRARPISAPDLSRYKGGKSEQTMAPRSGHSSTLRKRLRSAPTRVSRSQSAVSFTPRAVSTDDISEITSKLEEVSFNIITMDSRTELNVEAELDFYLPGYRGRRQINVPVTPTPSAPKRKPAHWTLEIIEKLTNPDSLRNMSHFRCCSAGQSMTRQDKIKDKKIASVNNLHKKVMPSTNEVQKNLRPHEVPSGVTTLSTDQAQDGVDQSSIREPDNENNDTEEHVPSLEVSKEQQEETKLPETSNWTGEKICVENPPIEVCSVIGSDISSQSKDGELINMAKITAPPIKLKAQKKVRWAPNPVLVASSPSDKETPVDPLTTYKDLEGLSRILDSTRNPSIVDKDDLTKNSPVWWTMMDIPDKSSLNVNIGGSRAGDDRREPITSQQNSGYVDPSERTWQRTKDYKPIQRIVVASDQRDQDVLLPEAPKSQPLARNFNFLANLGKEQETSGSNIAIFPAYTDEKTALTMIPFSAEPSRLVGVIQDTRKTRRQARLKLLSRFRQERYAIMLDSNTKAKNLV